MNTLPIPLIALDAIFFPCVLTALLIVMDELGPHEADAALISEKNPKPFGWADSHFRGITGTCRIFLA